ncbi:hypothetical protein CKO22_02195 [Thiococcus pfennigii]|nr:hypothetical protein [Thiococcus pfennigii]
MCQSVDGQWFRYGDARCNPVSSLGWVVGAIDRIRTYGRLQRFCASAIEIDGRRGMTTEDCHLAVEMNAEVLGLIERLRQLPDGSLTDEQLRVISGAGEASRSVTAALKGARPIDIRVER